MQVTDSNVRQSLQLYPPFPTYQSELGYVDESCNNSVTYQKGLEFHSMSTSLC
jgi:hypothetical protein